MNASASVRDPCAPPDLRHVRRLTDAFGIYQHTANERPLPEFGYSVDDVGRALIVVTEASRLFPSLQTTDAGRGASHQHTTGTQEAEDRRSLTDLADTYLRFIEYCQLSDGRFHNFVSSDRSFRDGEGSLDAYGRALWALGVASRHAVAGPNARVVLQRALPNVHHLPYLRSKAFSLLGLLAVLDEDDTLSVRRDVTHVVTDLVHCYEDAATDDWPWFEDAVRYANGILPYALLRAAQNSALKIQNSGLAERARGVGLRSLEFLLRTLMVEDLPAPIGNRGWYRRGGPRALYDQQCVDAADMVLACAEAWEATREERYQEAAMTWWSWFFGNNMQRTSLVRPEDGAVFDGLTENGVNENRGAESVVVFLLAHLKLSETFCA